MRKSIGSRFQETISSFTSSYLALSQSFEGVDDLLQLPFFVLPGATRELLTTDRALTVLYPPEVSPLKEDEKLDSLWTSEDEVDKSHLHQLLKAAGDDFITMHNGATEALNGDNPDRSRHVLTSLRNLFDHLLLKFAPNQEVEKWISIHVIAL